MIVAPLPREADVEGLEALVEVEADLFFGLVMVETSEMMPDVRSSSSSSSAEGV